MAVIADRSMGSDPSDTMPQIPHMLDDTSFGLL